MHGSENTKVTLLFLIVSCFVFPCVEAFAQVGNDKNRDDHELQKGIVLETVVLNQGYCASDNFHLHLLLKYTNVGSEPRILYKHTFGIWRHMVSGDSTAALKGSYQYNARLQTYVRMPDEIEAAVPNNSLFAILKPNQSHTLEVDVHLLIDDGKKPSSRDFIKPGKHALQLLVGTWYRDHLLATTLADRWRKYGVLWWQDIKSVPMDLTIPPFKDVIDCYGESTIGFALKPIESRPSSAEVEIF